jgi:hypothetical protein
MKTLKLFNGVLAKKNKTIEPFVSNEEGIIIEADAVWALKNICAWYKEQRLSGNNLNKTFHKSWKTIKDRPRSELFIHQILHYISTYGSNFQDEIYIPEEVLKVPKLKLVYKVVKAYTVKELEEKCLDMLKSGIALKEETVDDLISVLVDELNYTFTGKEGIRNKEAVIKIAETYNVFPANTEEFFRFVIYRTTGASLLIKDKKTIAAIKASTYNPTPLFKQYGLEKLASIFNRYKPLFLAYKGLSRKTINKISKLSKTMHEPMIINPLNQVTFKKLQERDEHWLKNATPFVLFKAFTACRNRLNEQDTFLYKIRNGKSWVTENAKNHYNVCKHNIIMILEHIKQKVDLSGKTFYFPKDIRYALPTSEKLFVGNIPMGTMFTERKLAVGIYWEDTWGASDLDLSGINMHGKTGWNSTYSQQGNLMFSGDITSAPNGAVEYMYANDGLEKSTILKVNVYRGEDNAGYKIIIGKGDAVSRKYMMNPNNLFAEIKTAAIQKETIIGIFLPKDKKQRFILMNLGAGNVQISSKSKNTEIAIEALYQEWRKPYNLKKMISVLGGKIVKEKEDADFDLSVDALQKDTFTKIFK